MSDVPARVLMVGRLNRPEYPQAPESFLTALAWRGYELPAPDGDAKKLALVFKNLDETRVSKTVRFAETYPRGESVEEWGRVLQGMGLSTEAGPERLGQAVADSLAGVGVTKSRSQAAVPLTRHTGLLQNIIGMTGKARPADIGLIVEQIFMLGSCGGSLGAERADTASALWRQASDWRLAIDPLLSRIDASAPGLLPAEIQEVNSGDDLDHLEEFAGLLEGTPFVWFAKSWMTVTSSAWVEALPARVWSDWATTVLRLGFGMSFLWEAAWFENLARQIVAGDAGSWEDLRRGVPRSLVWQPHTAAVSVRDVGQLLGRRVRRAHAIRSCVQVWLDSQSEAMRLSEALTEMRNDDAFRQELTDRLGAPPTGGKNTWEATKFALAIRDGGGRTADYYGLLRTLHRYTVVDPAPEWIAVISGLASVRPRDKTTVQQIARELSNLGLEPPTEELVRLLEAAGLARGSADADQAVIVEAAF